MMYKHMINLFTDNSMSSLLVMGRIQSIAKKMGSG